MAASANPPDLSPLEKQNLQNRKLHLQQLQKLGLASIIEEFESEVELAAAKQKSKRTRAASNDNLPALKTGEKLIGPGADGPQKWASKLPKESSGECKDRRILRRRQSSRSNSSPGRHYEKMDRENTTWKNSHEKIAATKECYCHLNTRKGRLEYLENFVGVDKLPKSYKWDWLPSQSTSRNLTLNLSPEQDCGHCEKTVKSPHKNLENCKSVPERDSVLYFRAVELQTEEKNKCVSEVVFDIENERNELVAKHDNDFTDRNAIERVEMSLYEAEYLPIAESSSLENSSDSKMPNNNSSLIYDYRDIENISLTTDTKFIDYNANFLPVNLNSKDYLTLATLDKLPCDSNSKIGDLLSEKMLNFRSADRNDGVFVKIDDGKIRNSSNSKSVTSFSNYTVNTFKDLNLEDLTDTCPISLAKLLCNPTRKISCPVHDVITTKRGNLPKKRKIMIPYFCGLCGNKFCSKNNANTHIWNLHPKVKVATKYVLKLQTPAHYEQSLRVKNLYKVNELLRRLKGRIKACVKANNPDPRKAKLLLRRKNKLELKRQMLLAMNVTQKCANDKEIREDDSKSADKVSKILCKSSTQEKNIPWCSLVTNTLGNCSSVNELSSKSGSGDPTTQWLQSPEDFHGLVPSDRNEKLTKNFGDGNHSLQSSSCSSASIAVTLRQKNSSHQSPIRDNLINGVRQNNPTASGSMNHSEAPTELYSITRPVSNELGKKSTQTLAETSSEKKSKYVCLAGHFSCNICGKEYKYPKPFTKHAILCQSKFTAELEKIFDKSRYPVFDLSKNLQ